MAKWIFPIAFLISSLLLLGAAFHVKPKPGKTAVVNTAEIFRRDEHARDLADIEEFRASLRSRRGAAENKVADGKSKPASFLDAEKQIFNSGFASRKKVFSGIIYSSYKDLLKTYTDESGTALEAGIEADYDKLLAELDSAIKALELSVFSEAMKDEKFRLFNQRLRLRTLSKRHIPLPQNITDDINSKIAFLQKLIRAIESLQKIGVDDKEQRIFKSFENQYAKSTRKRIADFKSKMEEKIVSIEGDIQFVTENYERLIAETSNKSLERRARLRGMIEGINGAAAARRPRNDASTSLDSYEKLFMESLRPRIAAAATDNGYKLILDAPLYHSPRVNDITEEFEEF
jgi:hypothetical protein